MKKINLKLIEGLNDNSLLFNMKLIRPAFSEDFLLEQDEETPSETKDSKKADASSKDEPAPTKNAADEISSEANDMFGNSEPGAAQDENDDEVQGDKTYYYIILHLKNLYRHFEVLKKASYVLLDNRDLFNTKIRKTILDLENVYMIVVNNYKDYWDHMDSIIENFYNVISKIAPVINYKIQEKEKNE